MSGFSFLERGVRVAAQNRPNHEILTETDITKNGNGDNPISQFQFTLSVVPATSFCL